VQAAAAGSAMEHNEGLLPYSMFFVVDGMTFSYV
jgi:hypothetical protein